MKTFFLVFCLLSLFFFPACFGKVGQVHISLTGKVSELLINWVSDSPKDATVANFGLTSSPDNSWLSTTGNVTSYSFEGYTSGGLHSVLLEGLATSTVYYYRVGDGKNDWSPVYSFKSSPKIGDKGEVIFGAIGDVGADANSNDTFQGLLSLINGKGLNLIIHAGDLSYANNFNPGGPVWDKYGELLQQVAASTPYEPSVGNHETIDNFTGFRLRYDTSALEANSGGGNFFWSIDYGMVHFIMLSSETDYSTSSDQYAWLQQDLQKVDRSVTPWIVSAWHRPWYNSNKAHHKEGENMRISFEPLFYKYKVDVGICGHVHAYERIKQVYNFKEDNKGTYYFTIGNGGTPEGLATSWYSQPHWSSFRDAHWGFYSLHVYNSTHAHWTYQLNSDHSVKDDYWIIKH